MDIANAAMLIPAISPSEKIMVAAAALAGAAASVLVPIWVGLIAANYKGPHQGQTAGDCWARRARLPA